MDYRIIRFVNTRPTGDSETWKDYPLGPVQDHARETVESGLAERVEVRDSDDRLIFQWPRTVTPAPASV